MGLFLAIWGACDRASSVGARFPPARVRRSNLGDLGLRDSLRRREGELQPPGLHPSGDQRLVMTQGGGADL